VVAAWVVARVLQVRRPAAPGRGQLAAERGDRRRVDAALAGALIPAGPPLDIGIVITDYV